MTWTRRQSTLPRKDTAVSVALPDIRRGLGVSLTGLEWVINAYTLALAVLVLPQASLPTRTGGEGRSSPGS